MSAGPLVSRVAAAFRLRSLILGLVSASLVGLPVHAQTGVGLGLYFDKAKIQDATYAAALAARDAEVLSRDIGNAGLLPSVNFSASANSARYQRQDLGVSFSRGFDYNPLNQTLQISQPLYSPERIAVSREGEVRAMRADLLLADARLELVTRLAQIYFNYLLAIDQIVLAKAQKEALEAQRTQAENLFKAGMATLTDVEETKARVELARVQISVADSALEVRRREFLKVTGELPSQNLQPLLRSPALVTPLPADVNTWVSRSRDNNPKVLATQAAVRIAEIGVERVKAAFLPDISLVASQQKARTANYFTQSENTTQIGVQLNLNLFAGGGTTAQAKQAQAQVVKARADLESVRADIELKSAQAYLETVNGMAQIQALEQAVKSGEITLKGMQVGQKAGLRTNSEVLNAQQQLFTTRRDLQKERYSYLLSQLFLQSAAGTLPDDAARSIDSLVNP